MPGSDLTTWHRKLHEAGGRVIGTPHVPTLTQELATVATRVWGPDGMYVTLYRQGQMTATGRVRWRGATVPAVNETVTLVKPMGNMNLGWAIPRTISAS